MSNEETRPEPSASGISRQPQERTAAEIATTLYETLNTLVITDDEKLMSVKEQLEHVHGFKLCESLTWQQAGRFDMPILYKAAQKNLTGVLNYIMDKLTINEIKALMEFKIQVKGFKGEPLRSTALSEGQISPTGTADHVETHTELAEQLIVKLRQDVMTGEAADIVVMKILRQKGKTSTQTVEQIRNQIGDHDDEFVYQLLCWKEAFVGVDAFREVVKSDIPEVVELFLEKLTPEKISLLLETKEMWLQTSTNLHIAVKQTRSTLIEALLRKLSSDEIFRLLQIKDKLYTVLYTASARGDLSVMKVLLDRLSEEQVFTLLMQEYRSFEQRAIGYTGPLLQHIMLLYNRYDVPLYLMERLTADHLHTAVTQPDFHTNMTVLHSTVQLQLFKLRDYIVERLSDEHLVSIINTQIQLGGVPVPPISIETQEDDENFAKIDMSREELVERLQGKLIQDLNVGTWAKEMIATINQTNLSDSEKVMAVSEKLYEFEEPVLLAVLQWHDREGSTPLHWAIRRKLENVMFLITQLVPPAQLPRLIKIKDGRRRNLLHITAETGLHTLYQLLCTRLTVEQFCDLTSIVVVDYSTCFHWCVTNGWIDTVQDFIEKFQRAGRDIRKVSQVKNDKGQYTLGSHTQNMTNDMKGLLYSITKEHLASSYEDKNLVKICLIFDNSEAFGIPSQSEYYKEAWWSVGVNTQILHQWSREQLNDKIKVTMGQFKEQICLLIVGIISPGNDGLVTDASGQRVQTEDIVRLMENLPSTVPKILLLETIPSLTKKRLPTFKCNLQSLNFTLITHFPTLLTNSYISYFRMLADILMSIPGGEGWSINKVQTMATNEILKHCSSETPLFESTFAKTFIIRKPKIFTNAVTHNVEGLLLHGGRSYKLRLSDPKGVFFFPEFPGEIISIAENGDIVYCLSATDTNRVDLHVINRAERKVIQSLLKFKFKHPRGQVFCSENRLVILGGEDILVYSSTSNQLYIIKGLVNVHKIARMNDGHYIMGSYHPDIISCVTSLEENSQIEWQVEIKKASIAGVEVSRFSGDVFVLTGLWEREKWIHVYKPNGEFRCRLGLPECQEYPVLDMSLHNNEFAIANGQKGVQIYLLQERGDKENPVLVNRSTGYAKTVVTEEQSVKDMFFRQITRFE